MENQVITNDNFVLTVKNLDKDFVLSIPKSASYQEAFNVTIQMLLAIYDMSKQVTQPSADVQPVQDNPEVNNVQ